MFVYSLYLGYSLYMPYTKYSRSQKFWNEEWTVVFRVFYRPIVLEVPHCALIRDREREVVVLRSDNGQTWREHVTPADDTPLKDTPTTPGGGILGQCRCGWYENTVMYDHRRW